MDGFTRSLHTLWTVFKHEFTLYWISPIAYLVGAALLFFAGLFFSYHVDQLQMGGGFFGGAEPSMINTLGVMASLTTFLSPALTMRLVADEVRSGTHELLLTAPVRDWEVITGKWLAAWAVYTVFILLTLPQAFLLAARGTPDQGLMIAGYLGLWLWSGAILAIGVFASAMTQYQLIAFFIGEFVALLLLVANVISQIVTQPVIGEIVNELTVASHFHDTMLRQGIIRPVDLGYFIGLIAICLFLATQTITMRRWRA